MAKRGPKVPFGERYRVSKAIIRESFRLFAKERDLWAYPLISMAVFVALFAPAVAVVVLAGWGGLFLNDGSGVGVAVTGLVFLGVAYPASVGVGVVHMALVHDLFARFEGHPISRRIAFGKAWRRVGTLARFTLLATFVGGVFQLLGILLEKLRIVPYLGRVANTLGMMAWAVASFFVIPVMAVENQTSALGSLRRSTALARDNWGKAVSGIVTIGVALLVPALLVYLVFVVLVAGFLALGIMSGNVVFVVMGMVIGVLMFVALAAFALVSQALQAIYRVVLYRYSVTGKIAAPFTPATIVDAWAPYRSP